MAFQCRKDIGKLYQEKTCNEEKHIYIPNCHLKFLKYTCPHTIRKNQRKIAVLKKNKSKYETKRNGTKRKIIYDIIFFKMQSLVWTNKYQNIENIKL